MNHFANVRLTVENGIGRIEFNRPESLNAFTRAMGLEVLAATRTCAADPAIRAVVFSGAGRAFSAGADVKDERPRTPEGNLDLGAGLNQIYNPLILAIRQMPKPVIAAVNGPVAGFACSLACACDFLIAAESAYFLLAFVRIGLVPDGGARVGLSRATQLAMLGDRLPATEALAWGLVNQVCSDEQLPERVGELARRLVVGPTAAYAEIKDLFNRTYLPELAAQLGAEAAAQYRRGISPDYAEGVSAFAEKRPPNFQPASG